MKTFNWNLKKLHKDLEYDNVSYRRTIVVSVLSMFLSLAVMLYSDYAIWSMSIGLSIVALIVLANIVLCGYSLTLNKKDYAEAVRNKNVVELYDDKFFLNGSEFNVSQIVKVVESEFKNSNILNDMRMSDDGKFVFIFVKGFVKSSQLGFLKIMGNDKVSALRIPYDYFTTGDYELFLEELRKTVEISKFKTDNTDAGVSKLFSKLKKTYENDERTVENEKKDCSSLEKF